MHEHRAVASVAAFVDSGGHSHHEDAQGFQQGVGRLAQGIGIGRYVLRRDYADVSVGEKLAAPDILLARIKDLNEVRRQGVDDAHQQRRLWRRGVLQIGVARQGVPKGHKAAVCRALLPLGDFRIQAGLVCLVVDDEYRHALDADGTDNNGEVLKSPVVLENRNQNRLLIFLGRAGIAPVVQHIADSLYGGIVAIGILKWYPSPRAFRRVKPQVPA